MDLMISAATHRMGSTLLQRIFNARRETLVWGENGGVLTNFVDIYNNVMRWSKYAEESGERSNYFDNDENPNTWIANLAPDMPRSEDAVFCSIRTLCHMLYHTNEHDFVGFKEVRYGKDEVELFRKCFPDATILLLVRNPVDTYSSIINATKSWVGALDNFLQIWNKRVLEYIDLSAKHENIFLIKYEDLVLRKKDILGSIKAIGKLTDEQIEDVLSVKIGNSKDMKNTATPDEVEYILSNMSTGGGLY